MTLHKCARCTALTRSTVADRCGRCSDWPEYDPAYPTLGDLGRVAEVVYARHGIWSEAVGAILDAMKAAEATKDQEVL